MHHLVEPEPQLGGVRGQGLGRGIVARPAGAVDDSGWRLRQRCDCRQLARPSGHECMRMTCARPVIVLWMLLAAGCEAATSRVVPPAVMPPRAAPPQGRTYAGTSDAGVGQLELRDDRSFSMALHFAYFGIRWDVSGEWRLGQSDMVELVVRDSRIQTPPDLAAEMGLPVLDSFEPGSVLHAFVADARASIGGPCNTFDLPRVR
jgi:hypothetical protein